MIEVIDNFLPEHLYDELLKRYDNPLVRYGWKSHPTDPHGHWNFNIAASPVGHGSNLADVTAEFDELTMKVWRHLEASYPKLQNTLPVRCYLNAATYGVEGYFHTDSTRSTDTTIIIYITDRWEKNWAGETVFADNKNELIQSVLPKKNRAVMFPSNVEHCARGVSRIFYGLRKTFMFKVREKRSLEFEKLSSYLYQVGAARKRHQNGSLHDHLVRTFHILETKGFPLKVCLGGGLHSIFGTNAFKSPVFNLDYTDQIKNMYGEEVVKLATLFSMLDRPKTLETPKERTDSYVVLAKSNEELINVENSVFESLRAIECANLIDQNELKAETYPNLYNFWQSVTITK